jgi:hypothetical protein
MQPELPAGAPTCGVAALAAAVDLAAARRALLGAQGGDGRRRRALPAPPHLHRHQHLARLRPGGVPSAAQQQRLLLLRGAQRAHAQGRHPAVNGAVLEQRRLALGARVVIWLVGQAGGRRARLRGLQASRGADVLGACGGSRQQGSAGSRWGASCIHAGIGPKAVQVLRGQRALHLRPSHPPPTCGAAALAVVRAGVAGGGGAHAPGHVLARLALLAAVALALLRGQQPLDLRPGAQRAAQSGWPGMGPPSEHS